MGSRLDESLSIRTLRKVLTGKTNIEIDISKIEINSSGIVQLKNNADEK